MKYLQDSFYDELDQFYLEIESSINCKISAANKIIDRINEIIEEMFNWLRNFTFEKIESEIYFFKYQKPRIISKLIYYSQLIEIESNLPSGKVAKKKYCSNKIQFYNLLNQKNLGFFQYYRSKKSNHDEKFFVRKTIDKKVYFFDNYMIHYDNHLNTTYDFNMAQIIAYDLIIIYLEELLENLNNKAKNSITNIQSSLKWTGNKIDLIELVYALHHSKSINQGKSDIKEVASKIGQFLNIEIEENIYRNYIDIKNRKTDKTKFLNILSQNLSDFIEMGEN